MADDSPKNPRAAGALLALSITGGAVAGVVWGQPTLGILAGIGVGVAIAIAVWLVDRPG